MKECSGRVTEHASLLVYYEMVRGESAHSTGTTRGEQRPPLCSRLPAAPPPTRRHVLPAEAAAAASPSLPARRRRRPRARCAAQGGAAASHELRRTRRARAERERVVEARRAHEHGKPKPSARSSRGSGCTCSGRGRRAGRAVPAKRPERARHARWHHRHRSLSARSLRAAKPLRPVDACRSMPTPPRACTARAERSGGEQELLRAQISCGSHAGGQRGADTAWTSRARAAGLEACFAHLVAPRGQSSARYVGCRAFVWSRLSELGTGAAAPHDRAIPAPPPRPRQRRPRPRRPYSS